MRVASDACQAWLASRQPGFFADLFTLTLQGGDVHRWCSLDIPVSWGGNTWIAQAPNIHRSALSVRNSAETPALEVTLSSLDDDFTGGSNLKQQIWQGALDGGRLGLDRLPMPFAGDTSLGPPITLYAGRIAEIELDALGARITVRGDVVLMSQYAPRNIFQTSCQHVFCDAGCTLDAATFTSPNTVGPGSDRSFIAWGTAPGNPAGAAAPADYRGGSVSWTSGDNAGQRRSIRDANSAGVFLTYPLYVAPTAGDSILLMRGCDKTLDTCTTAFANRLHYRGFPFVPDASFAV